MRVNHWLIGIIPLLLGAIFSFVIAQIGQSDPVLYMRASLSTAVFVTGLITAIILIGALWWHARQRQRVLQQETAVRARFAEDRRLFLQRLDHELKNPLMGIRAGLVNMSANDTDAQTKQAFAAVEAQTMRLSQLTGDLRKIADLETRHLECASVEVGPLLAEVVELAKDLPHSQGRNVALTVPQAPWPLPPVLGDRDLLFLAIYNLLENALKYTVIPDTIELRAREDGRFVIVEVADTGAGIAQEDQPYIWQELYRSEAVRGVPGSGLGLSLVRAIVERHEGQVTLSSRSGQGTLVGLRLPIN